MCQKELDIPTEKEPIFSHWIKSGLGNIICPNCMASISLLPNDSKYIPHRGDICANCHKVYNPPIQYACACCGKYLGDPDHDNVFMVEYTGQDNQTHKKEFVLCDDHAVSFLERYIPEAL